MHRCLSLPSFGIGISHCPRSFTCRPSLPRLFCQFLRNAWTSQPVTIDGPGRTSRLPRSFQSRTETEVADKDTARRKKVSRGSEFQKYRVFPVDIIKTGFPAEPSSVINVESFMNFIGSLSPRVSIVYSFRRRRIG